MQKNEFKGAIAQIAAERNISKETIVAILENALKAAYRRSNLHAQHQDIRVDIGSDEVKVYLRRTVVEDVEDERTEMDVEEAQRTSNRLKLGDVHEVDITPKDFGRIAAQTTKQVLLQGFREAERDHIYELFADREGDIVNGTVQRIDPRGITIELEPRAEAMMPNQEQVQSERYRTGQKIKVYLVEVQKNNRGAQLIVSRTHRNLLRRLFEIEVPEIYNGTVEIKSIAREPGLRSKVAVAARQEGVDPVGSCVGMRGVRIQNIVNELYGEKIDVLPWDGDMSRYIANALSPAQVLSVDLDDDEKSALVLVPQNQLSLAIGKEGQNARLAAKLTGWRIDIKPANVGAVSAPSYRSSGGNFDDDDFTRLARAALNRETEKMETTMAASFARAAQQAHAEMEEEFGDGEEKQTYEGETRTVRKDGTFTYNGVTLGPLPPHLAGQTVVLQDNGQRLLVLKGDELIRSFRVEEYQGDGDEPIEEGEGAVRETRKVSKDRMVTFRNNTFGPLPKEFIGQQVEIQLVGDHLDIYSDGELIDSYLWEE